MSNLKMDRVNSELARQIAKIIANEIKDPRLGSSIVGVTKAITTPDLKFAKVYLSIYAENKVIQEETLYTIMRSRGFIRNLLKGLVNMRNIPELTFLIDDSVDYGMKIESLLAKINIPKE